jgi:hypothetical protein
MLCFLQEDPPTHGTHPLAGTERKIVYRKTGFVILMLTEIVETKVILTESIDDISPLSSSNLLPENSLNLTGMISMKILFSFYKRYL